MVDSDRLSPSVGHSRFQNSRSHLKQLVFIRVNKVNLDEIFNQKSSSPGFPRSLRSAISSFVLHVMRSLVSTVKARGVSNLDETIPYRCIVVPTCSLQVTAWFTHDMR